jgi:hypothetical protein
MKKQIIIAIALTILGVKTAAQNRLSRQGVVFDQKVEALHIVDGLRLRSLIDYVKFGLRFSEISKIDTLDKIKAVQKYDSLGRYGAVEISIKKTIILNGMVLLPSMEREEYLSQVNPFEIKDILRLSRMTLLKKYNIKDTSGAVEITTIK